MLLFFVALSVIASGFCSDPCSVGPKYWCTDADTATQCGVLQFCKLQTKFNKVSTDAAKPVLVELYYESLCPGCRAFIMGQLWPTFQALKDLEILDIKLYPYGNAFEKKVDGKWEFTCQHGEIECEVNLIETCALHMLSHPNQFMEYIHCVESNPSLVNAKNCADQLKIEWEPISNCYNGSQGNHLEHQMAEATDALNPPHKYVPWLVGNGKHTEQLQGEMMENLLKWVCKTYQGTKPHVCRTVSDQKCYKNNIYGNDFK